MQYSFFKELADRILAAILLIVFFPAMLIIAIIVCLDSAGPAIYKQKRIGKFGKAFVIWKFRTMKVNTPVLPTHEMQLQNFDPLTRIGKFLRKTSLDEIPQLLNVLKGQMSIVGPRPALPTQDDINSVRESAGVLKIMPGITGLAQVMGRDELPADKKVAYDSEYCKRISFLLDLKIIFLTFSTVFTGRGNK